MKASYRTLTFERSGHVAVVRLNRPEVLNRMDDDTTDELVEIFESLATPGDVRALALLSTGSAFSAGGDLDEVLRLAEEEEAREKAFQIGKRVLNAVVNLPIPLVVGLQGDTFGLATSIILFGDVIVASRDARICDPHVKVGLVAGDGGCVAWPAIFGMARARRHLLTGDPLTAQDAYQMGGVTDLVDSPAEVDALALEIANRIADLPPIAVQLTKRALNVLSVRQMNDILDYSLELERRTMQTEDLREAIDAFKNKRRPAYRNR